MSRQESEMKDNEPEAVPVPKKAGIVPIIYRDGRIDSEPTEKQRRRLREKQPKPQALLRRYPLKVDANFVREYEAVDPDCCVQADFLRDECARQGVDLSQAMGSFGGGADCCTRRRVVDSLVTAYKLGLLPGAVTGE